MTAAFFWLPNGVGICKLLKEPASLAGLGGTRRPRKDGVGGSQE